MSRSRAVSLIIAGVYLLFAIKYPPLLFKLLAFLVMPLACIWFPDEMGNYTTQSFLSWNSVTKITPGFFVALGGWILLLLPIVIFLIFAFSHPGWEGAYRHTPIFGW